MKQLRREIDRRLDYVNYVTHEPQVSLKALLMMNDESITFYSSHSFSLNNFGRKISFISQLRKPGCQDGPHNHRLQLLDKIAELDIVIAR